MAKNIVQIKTIMASSYLFIIEAKNGFGAFKDTLFKDFNFSGTIHPYSKAFKNRVTRIF